MYKAVINDNYLCHYNKNHSKANGQFVSGDGDGDGIANDHANQNKKRSGVISGFEKDKAKLKKTRQKIIKEQKDSWKKKSKYSKTVAILGTAAGVATVVGLGATMVINHRNEKMREEISKQRARDYVESLKQTMWREAASKAKFAGGDW